MIRETPCTIYQEHIIRFNSGSWRVRCWIPYTDKLDELKREIIKDLERLGRQTKEEAARTILQKFAINGIELLEPEEVGVVFYDDDHWQKRE